MPQVQPDLKAIMMENIGFKVIALLITMVLWLTILGRREVIFTKSFNLEVIVPNHLVLVGQNTENIELKISGSRNLIRRYVENLESEQVRFELNNAHEGLLDFEVNPQKFNLPSNIRIQSIKPSRVRVEVMTLENYKKLNKK